MQGGSCRLGTAGTSSHRPSSSCRTRQVSWQGGRGGQAKPKRGRQFTTSQPRNKVCKLLCQLEPLPSHFSLLCLGCLLGCNS